MQHEITQRHPLLDENGHVVEAGWCKEYLLEYNRDAIKRPENEIREWEYYLILNKDYGLGLSMANSGNISRLTVQFMDYVKKARNLSHYRCNVDVEPGDRLLTLSTCTGTDDNKRLIVMARRLRDHENELELNMSILSTYDR